MRLIDKLYNDLDLVNFKLDAHDKREKVLSDRNYGIQLGRKFVLMELIESFENGEFIEMY